MTAQATRTLDTTFLNELVRAVGSVPSDLTPPEFTDYDWKACRVFTGEAWTQITEKTSLLTKPLAAVFAEVCQGEVEATVASIRQRYANEVIKEFADVDNAGYYLPIRREPKSDAELCGFLAIPPATARAWGKFLLGEIPEEGEAGNEPLSELEESLLYGTTTVLVEKVRLMDASLHLTPGDKLSVDHLPFKWPGTQRLLSTTFGIKPPGAETADEVTLLLPCDVYGEMAGWDPESQEEEDAEEMDCSEAIMACVRQMTVPLTALLGTVSLKLTELMRLEVGDVLVLDQPVHQTIGVQFAHRIAFRGIPGRQQQQQSLLITDACTQAS